MSHRTIYPAGVPCWVDVLTPDVTASKDFYAGLFGWQYSGPGPMQGEPFGEYWVATLRGHEVAGIGSLPAMAGAAPAPTWSTYVAVTDAEEAAAHAARAGGAVLVEPFDALPAGRMAVVADPSGAAVCLWEAAQRQGAQLVNEHSAWAMSVLVTDDAERARAFYGELFGWRTEPFADSLWLWRLDGYVGGEPNQPVPRDVVAALHQPGPGGPPAQWAVDLWIEDAERAAQLAPELGGGVVQGPFHDQMFKRAILSDPAGATFSVSQLLLGG